MVGQKELACMLGVSQSTISRAINGSGEVSEDMKKRIRDMAVRVGYYPSFIGKAFSQQKTQTISVLRAGSLLLNETSSRLISFIQTELRSRGYRFRLDHISDFPLLSAEGSADGFIILGEYESLPLSRTSDRPFVFIDCEPSVDRPAVVSSGNDIGGHIATTHLLDLGHRRVGFFGLIKHSGICRARCAGWQKAMRASGFDISSLSVSLPTWLTFRETLAEGDKLRTVLNKGATAIITPSFDIALGVMRLLKGHSLSVPDSISVMCFDDTMSSDSCEPSLTAIVQPLEEIAKAAVESVLNAIEEGIAPLGTVLAPRLIIRESTRARALDQ